MENFVYVTDSLEGIFKIEIEDSSHPINRWIYSSDKIWDVFVSDDLIFAHYQDGLKILKE